MATEFRVGTIYLYLSDNFGLIIKPHRNNKAGEGGMKDTETIKKSTCKQKKNNFKTASPYINHEKIIETTQNNPIS